MYPSPDKKATVGISETDPLEITKESPYLSSDESNNHFLKRGEHACTTSKTSEDSFCKARDAAGVKISGNVWARLRPHVQRSLPVAAELNGSRRWNSNSPLHMDHAVAGVLQPHHEMRDDAGDHLSTPVSSIWLSSAMVRAIGRT